MRTILVNPKNKTVIADICNADSPKGTYFDMRDLPIRSVILFDNPEAGN